MLRAEGTYTVKRRRSECRAQWPSGTGSLGLGSLTEKCPAWDRRATAEPGFEVLGAPPEPHRQLQTQKVLVPLGRLLEGRAP